MCSGAVVIKYHRLLQAEYCCYSVFQMVISIIFLHKLEISITCILFLQPIKLIFFDVEKFKYQMFLIQSIMV